MSAGPPARDRILWGALGIALAAAAGAGAWAWLRGGAAAAGRGGPAVLGELPDFDLTERSGARVTRASLAGRPWVADFIFTRCDGICPLLSARMSEIAKALGGRGGATLVSFSVDPDHDTPEVLAAYADRYGADPRRWLFLTGPRAEVHRLVSEGFRLSVAEAAPGAAREGELVTHSDRFVLVDGRGRIRAYYHGAEASSTRRVLDDLDRLLKER